MAAESQRERAKEERRDRIRASAEALIRTRGDADFSMRELADAAGVAFATPFNLFESKEGLLTSLLVRRIWPRQEALASASIDVDPIAHVLAFAAAAFDTYTEDEDLFRPLLHAVISPATQTPARSLDAAAELWTRSLEPARRENLIRGDCDVPQLDRAMHLAFRGALLGWVRGDMTSDAALDEVQFAIRMILAGAVIDSARDRLFTARL